MLNANNKVNYEPSIKQKEKKYSLSTVLAWLYLKTIGRMLPEKWNQWAKSILHYNIADNVVQTDDLLNSNREKELKDENERLKEKLKEGSKKEENQSNLNQELTKKEKEITKLKEQVKSLGEEKEIFAKFFAAQAQQIEDLELENEELKSKLAGLKKNYSELVEIAQKRGEEFLAQFKEKSEEILHLNKELINLSTKFANEKERLLLDVEEKDSKINNLMQLNEILDQSKKAMEIEKNEQQQTIFKKDQKIKEQEDLIKSFHENKDINKTVRKENENLRVQKTELENEVSKLKNESDTQIKQLENQLKQQQAELKQAEEKNAEFRKKLESTQQQLEQEKTNLNTIEKKKQDLESEINELKEQARGKDAEVENLKQQLEKEKTNLNTIEKEKKELESEINELKEKVQKLKESNVEIKKQKADLEGKLKSSQGENKKLQKQVEHPSAKKTENITTFSTRNNKEIPNQSLTSKDKQTEVSRPESGQQKLKNEQKDAGKKSEGMNKKTKAQVKTKELDAISIVSTAKSTTSKFLKHSKNLFVNKNKSLKDFLSDQNAKLKEGFPELEGKHFCHKVLEETIKSLSHQNGYKFKSDQLLELLESNLTRSARDIIEAEVKGVVKKYCNIGNIDKELRDGVLKDKLLLSIKKCMKNLSWDEEAANAITDSVLNNFHSKDNSNLQEIVSEELIKGRMKCFSDKIQELQLASSIRDKFLSPDQGMCNQTQGGVNEYQLTEKAKKEYKLTPNSSMSHTNSTPVSVKQEATSR
ncbi:coiled-coil domain-containing protein [Wolbachia endosymbiont (group B) of Dolichovespula media]|uniref:hypothetical protein n=1 Tax=Wolbachia endosymbiont (group B) of Dolichovespula media TaxID=2954001 RepID=UPI0021F82ABD|nr:hypothetical protein [Wolbachia endosymbiont (group B) of Dolichovespula media]